MVSTAAASPRTVLVTGATGYVGGRLVPCLLDHGCEVRCFVRDARRLRAQPWSSEVSVAVGDALAPDTLPPAMEGIDAVYYLIHSLGSGESTFANRDRRAAVNVRSAAAAADVERIIYLGGMRPKGERQSKHLQSRIETGHVLRDGPVPVIEFRAAQIVGAGSLSFELVRYLTERVPLMICPKWVQTPTQPIAIQNVLEYLIAALHQPESGDAIVEIGGSDVLTYAEMFEIYAAVRGLRRPIVHVPFLTPRLSSHWVEFVTPISNTIATPLIEGLDNEVVVDDPEPARSLFPTVEPLPYEAAVRLALRRPDSDRLQTVWNTVPSSDAADDHDRARTDVTQGLYRESRTQIVNASADRVFSAICRLGGQRGWPYAQALWRVRGWLDRAIGGVGFRRGRPDADELQVGDRVDFWRVESIRANELLRLRAEMKLPGRAWLQFRLRPASSEASTTELTQTLFFEPKGLIGTMYWTLVRPIHDVVFGGLLRALTDDIEQTPSAVDHAAAIADPGDDSSHHVKP